MRAVDPVEESDLRAWVDRRLTPERAEAVAAYFAVHPAELQEQWSQYAEQREALRMAFAAQAAEPIPGRLRIAHLTAERGRRQRHQWLRFAAAIGLVIFGGVGGWTDVAGETEFKYREENGIGAFYWVDDGLAYAIAANAPREVLLKARRSSISNIPRMARNPDSLLAPASPARSGARFETVRIAHENFTIFRRGGDGMDRAT